MTEKEYQLDKFYDKYDGQIPKRQLKKQFDKAWSSASRLGMIMKIADLLAENWLEAKAHFKK
jgi:hypothetical protein